MADMAANPPPNDPARTEGYPTPPQPPQPQQPQQRPPVAPAPSGYFAGAPGYGQPPQPPAPPYGQSPQMQASPYQQSPYQQPSSYQQPSPYQQQSPFQQQSPQPYGAPPSTSPFPPQPAGPYGPPPQQQQQQPPYGGDPSGLAQGMAGMDLGTPGTISRASKKKGRGHAYHDIGQGNEQQEGAGQSAFSSPAGQMPSQFVGGMSPQMGGPQGSPQFPATPGFPGQQPDQASFPHRPAETGHGITQSAGKIDPNVIPSIPFSRDAATAHFRTTMFPTLSRHLPPNAAADFVAHDQGNASPRFCRLTMNSVPATQELLASTSLPMALMLQPLAKQKPEEQVIPVLDFGEMGPPRCRRCRTYINPFVQFLQGGVKFRCNMCLFPNNEVPNEYYAPLDMAGVRVDRDQRPELMRGTVEFVVPKEYWAKKEGVESTTEGRGGAPMRWLFLIDSTEKAVAQGTLEAVVGGIREALYGESAYRPLVEGEEPDDEMQGRRRLPPGCKVGICTYNKEVHFYNLNPALEQAQMFVMPDIDEPFVPLDTGFFVDPYESRGVIESLLDALPNLFVNIRNTEPALLPALRASLQALERTGGKILCSLCSLPTWGPDRLVMREDTKIYNTDKERTLFQTNNPAWRTVAGKMVEAGVGVDFFMTPQNGAYMDVATISHLSGTTGGENYLYPNFHPIRDSKKLRDELAHAFHRETGYQALMKVRCSNGLQVSAYHGNFLQLGGGAADVEFGAIDEDKAVAVMFSYDGKLDSKVDAHFQSALLYTTKSGERRVRCSNVVAAVAEAAREAIRWVDQDAVVGVLAREATSRMLEKSLKDIRGALTEKCIEILAAYRKNASSANPPGQLVLPETLKEFAMYVLSLMKIRAFRGGNQPSDLRVHSARLLKSLPPADLQLYLYPRIIGVHNLATEDGFPDETGHLKIPAAQRASFGFVHEGDVFLVDNGQTLLLWLHAQVSPNLLTDLFGEGFDSLQKLDPTMSALPVLETHLNAQVRNIIQYLASQRGARKLTIQLARQGLDGAEYEFAAALVEDRNADERSYVDWLVHVHKYIQLEITGQRKRDEDIGSGLDPNSGISGLRPYW